MIGTGSTPTTAHPATSHPRGTTAAPPAVPKADTSADGESKASAVWIAIAAAGALFVCGAIVGCLVLTKRQHNSVIMCVWVIYIDLLSGGGVARTRYIDLVSGSAAAWIRLSP